MKIGILTFHWGTNHGAILQTFASVEYLKSLGHDVKVINYFPQKREINFKSLFKPNYPSVMLQRIPQYIKEKRLCNFRNNLPLTERYFSNQELVDNPPDVDLLLCGSDQIWNPSYALYGEGKITPVYFLNFGKKGCRRAALSASFGCENYPKSAEFAVRCHIENFDCISVRENTGRSILEEMGIENVHLTADPTALLSNKDYLDICKSIPANKTKNIATCILRKQDEFTKKLIKNIVSELNFKKVNNIKNLSMEGWLAGIRDASAVVTNSFHCVMMCLKLHTPFYVVLENGSLSGMNDRMYTLLEKMELKDRIITDVLDMNSLQSIDWEIVDNKLNEYSFGLKEYLNQITVDSEISEKFKISLFENKMKINHIGAYAAKVKDEEILMNSSSGGIFSAFAKKVIDLGGVVFGAAFTNDFKSVHHIAVSQKDELYRLQGSKYIQSNMYGVYPKVLNYLENNIPVLFSGTPCQIAGLRSFLKKDYEKLYCLDVVCHGTPVTEVWSTYVNYLENKYGGKLKYISFRDKRKGWLSFSVVYKFENGKEVANPIYKDLYMRGFLSNLFLKKSCYDCKFKGNGSCSDITLADYWGIQNIHPEFYDKNGISLVVIKTDKGCQLFNMIASSITFVKTDLKSAITYNSPMVSSVSVNICRDEFISNLDEQNFATLINKYCKVTILSVLKRQIKKIVNFIKNV